MTKKLQLHGSLRSVYQHLEKSDPLPDDEQRSFQIILKPQDNALPKSLDEIYNLKRTNPSAFGSFEEISAQFRPGSQAIAKITDFAKAAGFKLESFDPDRCLVNLSGTVKQINDAFSINLHSYKLDNGKTVEGGNADVHLPEDLYPYVRGVFGLETYPINKPQTECQSEDPVIAQQPPPFLPTYTTTEVAQIYDFPSGLDGTGQTVGVLSMGGGFDMTVLQNYFEYMKIPMPKIISVDAGGKNNYKTGSVSQSLPVKEVMSDIEIVGSIVPGATIAVYLGTAIGYSKTLSAAVNDAVNQPKTITASFAIPETLITKQEMDSYDDIVLEAACKDITICIPAGDSGSNQTGNLPNLGLLKNLALANFPSSQPGIVSVGGTFLVAKEEKVVDETVWNLLGWLLNGDTADPPVNAGAGGGGLSLLYPTPKYQDQAVLKDATRRSVYIAEDVAASLHSPVPNPPPVGRGLPDLTVNAIGYKTLPGGTAPDDLIDFTGTSAGAPLIAGLFARINQGLKTQLGFVNPALYQTQTADAFRKIAGSNGSYYVNPSLPWSACAGLGVPIGNLLMEKLGCIYK